jgi:hypothetical protein
LFSVISIILWQCHVFDNKIATPLLETLATKKKKKKRFNDIQQKIYDEKSSSILWTIADNPNNYLINRCSKNFSPKLQSLTTCFEKLTHKDPQLTTFACQLLSVLTKKIFVGRIDLITVVYPRK